MATTALLVDFFNGAQLAATVAEALADRARFMPLRQRAVQTARDRYSAERGIEGYRNLIALAMTGEIDA